MDKYVRCRPEASSEDKVLIVVPAQRVGRLLTDLRISILPQVLFMRLMLPSLMESVFRFQPWRTVHLSMKDSSIMLQSHHIVQPEAGVSFVKEQELIQERLRKG